MSAPTRSPHLVGHGEWVMLALAFRYVCICATVLLRGRNELSQQPAILVGLAHSMSLASLSWVRAPFTV